MQLNSSVIDRVLFEELDYYTECLIDIDLYEKTFSLVKHTGIWESYLSDCKSLGELYYRLFMSKVGSERHDESYDVFIDDEFFSRERFRGDIVVDYQGKEADYSYYLRRNDEHAILIIVSNKNRADADSVELEKIDAMQENYLFSMIADLKLDECINPNTTEASATRQNFMNIKYSDWRLMISNMFMESDKPMFFRMSDPEYVINTLEEKSRYSLELPMRNMMGEFIWVRLEFSRMRNFGKDNPKFLYTVKDINEDMLRLLKQESIVQAVEEQNKRLQEADQNKTKYFSSMSHELRTPINAIIGMNEAILRESNEDNIKSYAKDIRDASKLLLSSVNDILDYSKIEAGKMEIVSATYEPKKMVESVRKLLATKFADKGLYFNVEYDESIPRYLFGDEIRITQILVNMVTNAAKYTLEGGAVLKVKPVYNEEQFALDISLTDTGIGIKDEDKGKLLDEYGRLDMLKNRSIEGTGLGMGIMVGLLNEMGSSLSVESEYGKGSTFSFVLNQKIVENPQDEVEVDSTIPDLSGKTVVVVDDTPVNLRVAYCILKETGGTIIPLGGGAQCIKYLSEHAADLIFLDRSMPGMDGEETLKAIRALGGQFEKIPVVALTGDAGVSARDELLSIGFDEYMTKPYKTQDMYSVVKKLI